jgi:hypothetical protein
MNKSIYKAYDFYLKEFDFLFKFSKKNLFVNWVFTFDTSYFFSHFITWDNFTLVSTNERPNVILPQQTFDSELYNSFLSNLDMLAQLQSKEWWFTKPFGILDKYELHTMKKYKSTKLLDQSSFS